MTTAFGGDVTVHRRVLAGSDIYGNDRYTDVDADVDAIAFAPGGSTEVTQGRDTITVQPTLYLPADAVIDGLSAVTVDGVRYDVDGRPNRWQSPFTGWAPGVEVRLKAVTG